MRRCRRPACAAGKQWPAWTEQEIRAAAGCAGRAAKRTLRSGWWGSKQSQSSLNGVPFQWRAVPLQRSKPLPPKSRPLNRYTAARSLQGEKG